MGVVSMYPSRILFMPQTEASTLQSISLMTLSGGIGRRHKMDQIILGLGICGIVGIVAIVAMYLIAAYGLKKGGMQ